MTLVIDDEETLISRRHGFSLAHLIRPARALRERLLRTMVARSRVVLGAIACCLCLSFVSLAALPPNQDKAPPLCDCLLDCGAPRNPALRARLSPKSTDSHKLTVIVPFRDRFDELLEFVPFMGAFLEAQNLDYEILVVNQADPHRFNRAALINSGFHLSSDDSDYIAMHDVDLLPLNPNLSYSFPSRGPFHVAAPGLHPLYNYDSFVGGILLVSKSHFRRVNGLSNLFWGWGREDDDFYLRLRAAGVSVLRPNASEMTTGRQNTFRHVHGANRKRDQIRYGQQKTLSRQMDVTTGLDSVSYKVVKSQSLSVDGFTARVAHVQLHCDYDRTPWCDHLLSEEEIATVLARQKRDRQNRKKRAEEKKKNMS